jgi:hypothetical protein
MGRLDWLDTQNKWHNLCVANHKEDKQKVEEEERSPFTLERD